MEEKINKSIDRALQILELFSLEKPEWETEHCKFSSYLV
jgi:hypothetical protein